MPSSPTYQVLLLPRQEVVARACTLAEACAWVHGYNEIMQGEPPRAVIAEEPAADDQRALRVLCA